MSSIIFVQKAYLEMIYQIMLKRIAKGYSSAMASSIICREPDYFSVIKSLQIMVSTEQELQEIAWALGVQELGTFFPNF